MPSSWLEKSSKYSEMYGVLKLTFKNTYKKLTYLSNVDLNKYKYHTLRKDTYYIIEITLNDCQHYPIT